MTAGGVGTKHAVRRVALGLGFGAPLHGSGPRRPVHGCTPGGPSGRLAGRADSGGAGFVLATTTPGGPGMAPAFVGNGYLAGRQPFDGQGFAEVRLPGQNDPLPTQSEVHGLYALGIPAAPPGSPPQPPVERRAALPAWSTLSYDDGSGAYALSRGEVAGYRQALDVHTGTLTTSLTWTSPAGRKVDLRYDVTPDRAHRRAAVVRLRIVPRFSGPVTVTDTLDGRAAELLDPKGTGHASSRQWVDVATSGPGSTGDGGVHAGGWPGARRGLRRPADREAGGGPRRTTWPDLHGHQVRRRGHRLGLPDTRTVGRSSPRGDAAERGYLSLRRASDAAWARLWRSDIVVSGDARLQRQVRASFFALLASVRSDTPWAPSPGGLSSDGYNGHVFWDSETWMYPSLLATEPAIARASLRYRFDRLRGCPCQRGEDRLERGPVPVGECAARQRGDPGVRQDRAARDPRQRGHLARGAPVLAGDRRPALAGDPGLADAQGHRRLLRGPGDAERGWLLQHPRRHPA